MGPRKHFLTPLRNRNYAPLFRARFLLSQYSHASTHYRWRTSRDFKLWMRTIPCATAITLTAEQRAVLEALGRSTKTEVRRRDRARIVLLPPRA